MYAVNGELIPFEGWVVITVNLPGNEDPNLSIIVPFLVSPLPQDMPLVGFNVVVVVIQEKPERLIPTLTQMLREAMSIPNDTAQTIVHFVQRKKCVAPQGRLRIGQKVIPAGGITWVKSRVPLQLDPSDSLVLFEPEESCVQLEQLDIGEGLVEIHNERHPYVAVPLGNHTKHDIILPRKSPICSIQPIKIIVETDSPEKRDVMVQGAIVSSAQSTCAPRWQPPVHLSHLNKEQQEVVSRMLYEESSAFSRDASDIGCIPSLRMYIDTKDEIPVQKAYSSVPKHLVAEVEKYIQDLLAKGWIVKSRSRYAAPVVCV